MLQVKLCEGNNISQLEKAINEALLDINTDVDIVYDLANMADVMGLCHRKGQRKRFNAKACNEYSDIRD